MVLGLGVDIISISLVKDAIETGGQVFLNEVFTPQEQRDAEQVTNTITYFAGRFAAKEAIFKALSTGWESGGKFNEIEIRVGEHGEPVPVLAGKFAALASARGATKVLLSLSSDGDYSVAVAILT